MWKIRFVCLLNTVINDLATKDNSKLDKHHKRLFNNCDQRMSRQRPQNCPPFRVLSNNEQAPLHITGSWDQCPNWLVNMNSLDDQLTTV